jgi:surfeit locus 1 family protein
MRPLPSLRGGFEFRFRLWPALAAGLGIALTVALGAWQLARAEHKEALRERSLELGREPPVVLGVDPVEAPQLAWRRVEVRGRFEPGFMVYLDNRVHQHRHGYHVIMPLQIGGSRKYVLVNRGWIAATADRIRPPPVRTPEGAVVVRGIAQAPSERFLELSTQVTEGNVWQNLALERYRAVTGLDVHPLVVRQEGASSDGLLREWPAPDFGRDTHLAYAVQWFALAVAILVAYFALHVRRRAPASGTR